MQIIRNELVVALEFVVRDVKKDRRILALGAFAKDSDREFVPFKQGRQKRRDKWFFQNLPQRLVGEQWDQLRHEIRIRRGFDHHGQLHRGRFHLDRRLRVFVHSAIDDVGPVHQIGNRFGVETETLLGHLGRVEDHYAELFEEAPTLSGPGSLVFTGTENDPDTVRTLGELGFKEGASISARIRGWHAGRLLTA